MNWHILCHFYAFDAFNVYIMCITHAYHAFCAIFVTDFALIMSHEIRKYCVIIATEPKRLCNIVWNLKKDIAEGWS